MTTSWRRFAFFSERVVGALESGTVCCSLSDGGVAQGDALGVCHLLDESMKERCAFAAHDRGVTHLLQPRGSTLLFSLGLELEGAAERTFMRVWRPEVAVVDGCEGSSLVLIGGYAWYRAQAVSATADRLSFAPFGEGLRATTVFSSAAGGAVVSDGEGV